MSDDANPEDTSEAKTDGIVGASSLGRNSTFLLLAEMALAAGRVLTFVLLGRSLGVEVTGQYAAILALTQLIFPVSRFGIAHLMVRAVSTGKSFGPAWAKTASMATVAGPIGALVVLAIALVIYELSFVTILLISTSQLVSLALQHGAVMAAAALSRAEVGLYVNASNTLLRVVAILIFFFGLSEHTIDSWAWFLFVAGAAGSVSTIVVVRRFLGAKFRLVSPTRAEFTSGSPFVFVDLANTAQADIDKVVLGGYGLDEDAGAYAAATRVLDLANLPLAAVVRASYSEFFRRGSNTIEEAVKYAKKLTALAVTYGLFAGVGLWILAPSLTFVLGDEFVEAPTALRWLAFVPAVRASQFFPANTLTGTDRQWTRARIMSTTAVGNLIANLIFVPAFGWRAAAVTTIVTELVFSALLWIAVNRALRNERDGNNSRKG